MTVKTSIEKHLDLMQVWDLASFTATITVFSQGNDLDFTATRFQFSFKSFTILPKPLV
jgi:hypothetical protein